MPRSYIAIDLKSFYASVECVERGMDPMKVHLVVADESRTEKTICLAATPALKKYGVPGRARLFEVIEKVQQINALRRRQAPGGRLAGASYVEDQLQSHAQLAMDFIRAVPRMGLYMQYSTRIYQIYLRYAAPEDIHVYSIDEVFIDATPYLAARRMTARQFAAAMIRDIMTETGIAATAGIGTNLYLCKVAMDIVAKHVEPDEDGVRIAQLDEENYRRQLWSHRPLTDFWRVGGGYARKLEQNGLYTMGDIARCSLGRPGTRCSEDLLYRLFGVNAELLIDHAWGWEPCTMADIKAYRPQSSSLSTGQVLTRAYSTAEARIIVKEMAESLALDLVGKRLVTRQVNLTVGYDVENLTRPDIGYEGEVKVDFYGRRIPKHAHGTEGLGRYTSSTRLITEAMLHLYDRIIDPKLLVRRLTLVAEGVTDERSIRMTCEQLDLFADHEALEKQRQMENRQLEAERRRQEAVLQIRKRFGKNAILMGMSLEEGATAMERNRQIGGHRA